MQHKAGDRVSKVITGTVLEPDSLLVRLFGSTTPIYDPDHYTHVQDDTTKDVITIYTPKSGRLKLTDALPVNWPPKAGDMWAADDGNWYAKVVDTGSRKALRMVHYEDLGDVIRNVNSFLKDHPQAKLQRRVRPKNDQ